MSGVTAFDKTFAEAMPFSEGYGDCISALQYKTEQDALQYFYEYENCQPKGWGFREGLRVERNWVKWHGGIDDDGQMRNAWWINPEYEGTRGAKPVWSCRIDWHTFHHGHEFKDSGASYKTCEVCGGRP